jgi:four helix bundle protein
MLQQKEETYHEKLRGEIDAYAHLIYAITKTFPREELYGVISQLRRSALSIALNYIEGYARQRDRVHENFLEISYGSLKESKYLLHFSLMEGYLSEQEYTKAVTLAEHIGAMLWGILKKIRSKR